ncbi:MAG: HAD family acid phosphatase [Thermodesulfobacteriota bacterium]
MKHTVIFDLDGTLCDITHRLHFIQGDKKDWPAFYQACVDDIPILHSFTMCQILKSWGCWIYIITGRSREVEKQTKAWLSENGITFDKLIMRPEKNYQPAVELKETFLKQYFPNLEDLHRILVVFEDSDPVIAMYESYGIPYFKVGSHLDRTEINNPDQT